MWHMDQSGHWGERLGFVCTVVKGVAMDCCGLLEVT